MSNKAQANAVKRALKSIPSEDRDVCIKVGMALLSFFGKKKGYLIWDKWLSKGDNYDQTAMKTSWDSFDLNGSITIGTIFHYAKENGFKLTKEERVAVKAAIKDSKANRKQRKAEAKKAKGETYSSAITEKCRSIWNNAEPADEDHPYLVKKQVPPFKLRQDGYNLMVPVTQNGTLVGIQYTNPDGGKWFKKGSVLSGSYYIVGPKGDDVDTVLLCEGWATASSAHMATGLTCVVAFNAGNLKKVALQMADRFPDSEIAVLADDDQWTKGNPGITKATEAAESIGAYLVIPVFKSVKSKPTDFNDLHCLEGIDVVAEQIEEGLDGEPLSKTELKPYSKEKADFQLVSLSNYSKRTNKMHWLIKNYMEMNSVGIIFGDPASGKSFLALEWGFCVATGIDWHGHKVTRGKVVCLVGEGHGGIGRRFEALEHKYGTSTDDFIISTAPAALIDSGNAEMIWELIQDACPDVSLIIVDTLNRNFGGGDENSSHDFALFMQNIDDLFRSNGAAVLIVHHSGHSNKGRGRGSSAIKAAMDVEYRVDKKDDAVTMTCTKAKDFPEPQPKHFNLVAQPLGINDEDGIPVESAVLEPVASLISPTSPTLSDNETAILDSLEKALSKGGKTVDDDNEEGMVRTVVSQDKWKKLALPNINVSSSNHKKSKAAKRKAFNRGKDKLLKLGLIACITNLYFVVDK